MKELFPAKAFIGEGCYWLGPRDKDTTYQTQKAFFDDKRFPRMKTWNDALSVAVDDAIACRSNTFDLRTPFENKTWIEKLPNKVQEFITYGGYRLYPESVTVAQNNRNLVINHFWKNFGVGVLPNNHPNWNNKYKVAFGLINPKTGQVVYNVVDPIANPGKWLKGETYSYPDLNLSIPKSVPKGDYQFAVAIIDATTGKPGIKLSIQDSPLNNQWTLVKRLEIK
ncbi:hypothetical protein ACRASX_12020 [Flavobacterium sp. TMP13]|uniref:hypothetical protein n=1 Tax=Flavobacterium sp. TMP13 TaxID=3425950 RepID=UPI003D78A81F